MKNANLENLTDEYTNVTNDEGVFKNCIAIHQWIPIGDNGGNTILQKKDHTLLFFQCTKHR